MSRSVSQSAVNWNWFCLFSEVNIRMNRHYASEDWFLFSTNSNTSLLPVFLLKITINLFILICYVSLIHVAD